jgi:hypothetical protein
MMTVRQPKKWLLLGALVLLIPAFSFAQPGKEEVNGCALRQKCRQVPDGGSALSYLLAVGATCLGAMAVRSRLYKSEI